MKNKRFFSALMVIVFLLSVSENEAVAKWPDNSNELPGMVSDGEMLLIAGGGIVLIGGLVTYLIIKKKQDKKMESSIYDFKNFGTLALVNGKKANNNKLSSLYNEIAKASEKTTVLFYARCNNIPNQNYTTKQGISLGVRVSF